jgi:hypothetical protein
MLLLFRDSGGGDTYLQVTCGGIVWLTFGIQLTLEEIEEYEASPDPIVRLARDVCYRPSFYEERLVSDDLITQWNP